MNASETLGFGTGLGKGKGRGRRKQVSAKAAYGLKLGQAKTRRGKTRDTPSANEQRFKHAPPPRTAGASHSLDPPDVRTGTTGVTKHPTRRTSKQRIPGDGIYDYAENLAQSGQKLGTKPGRMPPKGRLYEDFSLKPGRTGLHKKVRRKRVKVTGSHVPITG